MEGKLLLRLRGSAQRGPGRAASRLPLNRGREAGRSWSATGPHPNSTHSPCPISLPRARELATFSAAPPPRSEEQVGGIGAREAASRREEQGGSVHRANWNFLPPGLQGFGGTAGEAKRKGSSQAERSHSHR